MLHYYDDWLLSGIQCTYVCTKESNCQSATDGRRVMMEMGAARTPGWDAVTSLQCVCLASDMSLLRCIICNNSLLSV